MTVSANSVPSAFAGSVECGEVYEDESAAPLGVTEQRLERVFVRDQER